MSLSRPLAIGRWTALLLGWLIVLALPGPASAAPDYPALTGRVVDQANLLDATARGALEARLAAHEKARSEEHTSELQSLMRISYAVFRLKKKNNQTSTEQ